MKKFFYLTLALLFAGALTFSSCSSKPSGEEQEETEVVEETMDAVEESAEEVEEVVEEVADSVEAVVDSASAM